MFEKWRLLVRHRAGSIEAAVGRMRRRNLAVSFGILAVLGAATGLLFVSTQRAQRLAARQMAFVAGVTHELRTPLAVIRSAAENLADGVVRDPEQARRYGTLIHQEGRRLSALVEQALALAGAHAAGPAYTFRPVAVGALVEAALERCRPDLDAQGFTVDVHVAPGLPPVHGDGPALEAALCNLLTNAAKYSGDARRIGLDARCTANGQAGGVAVTVRDQGVGITPDERARLFEPFFRGRAAREGGIRGSGLGLSLVRHTIDAHGGTVRVESRPGRGSTFTMVLPATAPEEAP